MKTSKYSPISFQDFVSTYSVAAQEGTMKVSVRAVSPEMQSLSKTNYGGTTRIVNFRVVKAQDIPRIKQLFQEGCVDAEGVGGVGFAAREDISKFEMRFNIEVSADGRVQNGLDIPLPNQTAHIIVSTVVSKGLGNTAEGEEVLVINGFKLPVAVQSKASAFFGDMDFSSSAPESNDIVDAEIEIDDTVF